MHNYHRVWAEVNLDAIRANMESFRDNVPKEAMLCGVIKTTASCLFYKTDTKKKSSKKL